MTPEQAAHWIIGRIGSACYPASRPMTPVRIANLLDLEVEREPRYGGSGFEAMTNEQVERALADDLKLYSEAINE